MELIAEINKIDFELETEVTERRAKAPAAGKLWQVKARPHLKRPRFSGLGVRLRQGFVQGSLPIAFQVQRHIVKS